MNADGERIILVYAITTRSVSIAENWNKSTMIMVSLES